MSSLKDWYEYVDSKARSREKAPGEPDPSPAEQGEGEAPAEAGPGLPAAEGTDPVTDRAGAEADLDVWSGLFPGGRKPEPKPATGPLKLPSVSSAEVPAELSFIRAPVESPPTPRFELPQTEVAVPSFEEFVSPVTPEPVRAPELAPTQAARVGLSSGPSPGAAAPRPGASQAGAAASESEGAASAGSAPAASTPGPAPPPVAAAEPTASASVIPAAAAPEEEPLRPVGGARSAASVPPEAARGPEQSPSELSPRGGTVVHAVSSSQPEQTAAAPGPVEGRGAAVAAAAGAVPGPAPSVERPVPGTPAWERERVERLARTFRETLQALEETLSGARSPDAAPPPVARPRTPDWWVQAAAPPQTTQLTTGHLEEVEPAPTRTAAEPGPPAAPAAPIPEAGPTTVIPSLRAAEARAAPLPVDDAAAPPVLERPDEAAAPITAPKPLVSPTLPSVLAPAASVSPTEVGEPGPAEATPDVGSRVAPPLAFPAESSKAEAPIDGTSPARLSEEGVSETAGSAAPLGVPAGTAGVRQVGELDVGENGSTAAAAPDVLQNIREAALIRERLPQHMDMLLRIPTNEVAQNSYKSPFRETREDLIGRLLDPRLTLEEAARILGVCPTTVRRYTNRGMLHCHRTPGNQRRFRMSDVLQFLEQHGDRIDRAAEARPLEEAV